MWGWFIAIAGAVGGGAAVVLFSPVAVGYGIVAAGAVVGGLAAFGANSIIGSLKGGEGKKGQANLDHAHNLQNDDKAKADLEMQAVLEKVKYEQKIQFEKAEQDKKNSEINLALVQKQLIDTKSQLKDKTDECKKIEGQLNTKSAELQLVHHQLATESDKLEKAQSELATNQEELKKVLAEKQENEKKYKELSQSQYIIRSKLGELLVDIEKDKLTLEKLEQENKKLKEAKQVWVKSQSSTPAKSAVKPGLASDIKDEAINEDDFSNDLYNGM